ncbi:MAG: hypothetical protein GXY86_12665 [Firmicutes bacterium]|nr:hypothetical protein [Bacillota bacterium]
MFRKTLLVVFAIMFLGLTVYADYGYMAKSDRTLTPEPERALIVFIRPKPSLGRTLWTDDFGQAISLYDVSEEDTKFIGILYQKTKVCYDLDPGEYTFMVVGAVADFMKATVEPGKTYYVLLSPRVGTWKARFSFQPLRRSDLESSDFAKWNSKTDLIENTSDSEAWATEKADEIEAKRADNWPAWCELSSETQAEMTLNSEDGR